MEKVKNIIQNAFAHFFWSGAQFLYLTLPLTPFLITLFFWYISKDTGLTMQAKSVNTSNIITVVSIPYIFQFFILLGIKKINYPKHKDLTYINEILPPSFFIKTGKYNQMLSLPLLIIPLINEIEFTKSFFVFCLLNFIFFSYVLILGQHLKMKLERERELIQKIQNNGDIIMKEFYDKKEFLTDSISKWAKENVK